MLKEGVILGERYEIISRIGSGGMADVYKAKDHKLNRMVAVKVLKPEFREDKTFIRKFRTEAQAAAGLSHPNIVNVYDVGEDRGVYYIVMELVEGITLKDYIDRKGKLSVKEATSIAIQVSLGLEAAHNRNIVHRDVKPQNIIISTDGKVKLSDFGIAKATSSNTISSNVMGSVHYSSPEQVRGGYSDYKSDIYSLGITMYEMVTGRVPFDGDTTVAIAIKHLQEEIESPSKYTPNLPFALEQIILKCTQKSPDRRYNNMAELIDDLKHSLMEPQGNFVKVTPLSSHAETVMVSAEELSQIRSGAAAKANAQTAEEPARKRYSKIEDEEEDEDYSYEDEEDEDEDEEEDEEIEAHGPNPYVTYSRNDLENLDPAYAITIHKSQGSEFPAVIMPFLNSHFVMLERNLLYTGVTRAKKYLFLKGQRNAIYKAVKTISMLSRNSNLRTKLQGDFGQISFFGENMGLY